MIHKLKTWKYYFHDIAKGVKLFEVRKNDRAFLVGDYLELQEYDNDKEELTGNAIMKKVIYLLPGGKFGIEPGYCVLGLNEEIVWSSIK